MKIWILILSGVLWYTTVLGQNVGSVQDQLIREAATQFNDKEYESVLLTLSKLENQQRKGLNNERYFYFSIRSRYNLLKEGEDITFENISKIRILTQSYLSHFKDGNSSKISEISDIHQDVSYSYPSTLEAYKHWQQEQERLAFEHKQKEALRIVEETFSIGEYLATLQLVEKARAEQITSSKFDYYEILAKNELYKASNSPSYQSIQGLLRMSESYLKQSDLDQNDRDKIEQIALNYPKTLEEFNDLIESERLAAIEKDQGEKLSQIQKDYYSGNYSVVLQAMDTFGSNSERAASFSFFKAMSAYKYLLSRKDTYYNYINASDISGVRDNLSLYINRYGDTQPANGNEVKQALIDLNKQFGHNDFDFNKLKNRVLNDRDKAYKRASRKMFVSVGYEYGEVAPYGIRFEVGGRAIGFFTTIRSSMIKDEKILNSYDGVPNKNEIIMGPNVKIANWLFWNVGLGYGYFSHLYRDDYKREQGIRKSNYLAGYTGGTLRLGSVVNLLGGVSFIDLSKKYTQQIGKPEYTFGITFNFK